MKIARLESLHADAGQRVFDFLKIFGRRDYKPFFDAQAVDVAIVDAPWNGVGESVKIANMADIHEINVAPHSFYGPLATLMSAHLCAVVPNLRIMEIDPDQVPLVRRAHHGEARDQGRPRVAAHGPGGTEVNEEAVLAHPPRKH
jgi:L-alanine-DL-glutamate epimerase-like enolase superfamily enzyme